MESSQGGTPETVPGYFQPMGEQMIKHVAFDTSVKIRYAVQTLASIERGCRQRKRKESELMAAYLDKASYEAKALPKKGQIRIIYKRTENLSNSTNWGDYYTAVTYVITDAEHIKFTDKAVIVYPSYNFSKTVIKHKNIIAFVW